MNLITTLLAAITFILLWESKDLFLLAITLMLLGGLGALPVALYTNDLSTVILALLSVFGSIILFLVKTKGSALLEKIFIKITALFSSNK